MYTKYIDDWNFDIHLGYVWGYVWELGVEGKILKEKRGEGKGKANFSYLSWLDVNISSKIL